MTFFHTGLADAFDPIGVDGWLDPSVVAGQRDVAAAFAAPGKRVACVALEDVLVVERADAIAAALDDAAFVPHHHAPYPLHIAPRAQQSGVLAAFMDWLGSPRTARLHMELVGLPPDRHIVQTQVQVSRMTAGEFFPPHVDTMEPALACIYNFTRGFSADGDDGGALCFIDAAGDVDHAVLPTFNSVAYFHSSGVLHAVSPVTKPSASRYSATVFYVWQKP